MSLIRNQDALSLQFTRGQRVLPLGVATLDGAPAPSFPPMALSAEYNGDPRRVQGADPALPLRRAGLSRLNHMILGATLQADIVGNSKLRRMDTVFGAVAQ